MPRVLANIVLMALLAEAASAQSSTIYTTHFFDWYRVSDEHPYEAHQRVFTFRPDWESVGLEPSEMGVSQRYYAVQFRMVKEAGFDGIHYEWFGPQPSEECIAALRETGTKVAMFYDQEIRFQGRNAFIKPTAEFRDELTTDVGSFYERIPSELRLREADGRVPLIFYGYQFDQSVQSVDEWRGFFEGLLGGLRERLGAPVRIYWTDCGALCQAYAFQHFADIVPYSFSWWGGQRQFGKPSVTFVAHYDDRGAVAGGRSTRSMAYDPQLLEEHLQLARRTRPGLVFNYGWNEYYEGENIFPDRTWGDWRLRVMAAIVRRLKEARPDPLPPVVVLADDLYAGDIAAPGSRAAEATLLGAFRYLLPQADTRLGISIDALPPGRPTIIAMSRMRTDDQERRLLRLADTGRARVVFYEPDPAHTGPMVRRFAVGARTQPMEHHAPPPSNQWVGARVPVDVDPAQYPFVRIRVRNSPDTNYHVRVMGIDGDGTVHTNHDMNSPMDWKTTGGGWEERRENMRTVLEAYAAKPIVRFTGLVLIINAFSTPGDFSAEFDDAEFVDADGNVGLRVPIGDPGAAHYEAPFANTDMPGFPVGGMAPGGQGSGTLKLILKARFATDLPLDTTSQSFEPAPEVTVLAWSSWPPVGSTGAAPSVRVPLVLRRGDVFWVNTLAPNVTVYRPLLSALGMPPVRAAQHTVFQQAKGTTTVQRPTTPTILGRDVLPIDHIRFHHPADVDRPVSYPWPTTSLPLAANRTRDDATNPERLTTIVSRTRLVLAGMAEMQPGDTLDIYRVPVRIVPSSGTVQIAAVRASENRYDLLLTGKGAARVTAAAPRVRVTRDGKAVQGPVPLPCRVVVTIQRSPGAVPTTGGAR